jgi:hypothetical protein
VYDHVSQLRLERYLAEFDVPCNEHPVFGVSEIESAETAMFGIVGMRFNSPPASLIRLVARR